MLHDQLGFLRSRPKWSRVHNSEAEATQYEAEAKILVLRPLRLETLTSLAQTQPHTQKVTDAADQLAP